MPSKRNSPQPPVARICARCGAQFTVLMSMLRKGKGTFCSRTCKRPGGRFIRCRECKQPFQNEALANAPTKQYICSDLCKRAALVRRFWSQVEKTETCWLWIGNRHAIGYGRCGVDGTHAAAHRVAWELTNGPIPDGMFCLHTCDVRACVRPAHLFLGTQADNMQDMVAKGRAPWLAQPSRRHPTRPLPS